MEVNSIKILTFPAVKKDNAPQESALSVKTAEYSALNALAAFGKAQLGSKNLQTVPASFKAAAHGCAVSDFEFEKLRRIFEEKIKYLPVNMQKYAEKLQLNKSNINAALLLISSGKFLTDGGYILFQSDITPGKAQIIQKIFSDETLSGDKEFMENRALDIIRASENNYQAAAADAFLSDKRFRRQSCQSYDDYQLYKLNFYSIIKNTDTLEKLELLNKILQYKEFSDLHIDMLLNDFEMYSGLKKLYKTIGTDKAKGLSEFDTQTALIFADFYGAASLDELSVSEKSRFLKALVSLNSDLFNHSGELKTLFPLLPLNKKEYCALVPAVVNSLETGIKPLPDKEISNFYAVLDKTAQTLKNISGADFKTLDIKYSKKSGITCRNKVLEPLLNGIIKFLPELISTIGRKQHGAHDYDVFTHSLKVLHGIVNNPKCQNLNVSDKKIMLLAALFHDITKQEGKPDRTHAENSSFETALIARKLKLSKEEEIKLYTLIKTHEWLGYANSTKVRNETELEKRRQSIAYDLRHDNFFDMSLMFTHADLKAVSCDFHSRKEGKGRTDFTGAVRSFAEAADFHAGKIREYINELKKSQPLLPVTPFPKADVIEKAVSKVNSDGSTDIKGVYKDKDGLIILKYSELENKDLEKIGFPKGSLVKGIKAKNCSGAEIDTGNIKFFVHGLEQPVQLTKFHAFALPDSDVLLSASWAERPESKYRFFRPQGVILDCSTKYIHGGGHTDSGSGYGKSIDDFKKRCIFGGEREKDRTFISDLIKQTLNLNDDEYIEFIKINENKPMNEIEPKQAQEALVKAFAGISSKERRGSRQYNEMYISNPKPPMAVYAYSEGCSEKIKNPAEFLNRTDKMEYESCSVKKRTAFLKKFALENNIPFVIFGG